MSFKFYYSRPDTHNGIYFPESVIEPAMERVAYVQQLDPDRVDEYVEAHDDVPSAVTDAMERGDVDWFDLFVRDDVAVCVAAVEDPEQFAETYDAAIEDDPAVEEWERRVGEFKREGVDVEGEEKIPFMDRIWSFEPGN